MRIRDLPVIVLIALVLTGCSLMGRPLTQGTYVPFEHGTVEVRVTEGELPDLGTFTLDQAGRYDGWGMEDGTNDSLDESQVMSESNLCFGATWIGAAHQEGRKRAAVVHAFTQPGTGGENCTGIRAVLDQGAHGAGWSR